MAAGENADGALIAASQKAFVTPFAATLLLLPDEGGAVWVNGTSSPPEISQMIPENAAADCTWRGSRETLQRVLDGERALESAYVAGRIRIAGDMSVMKRLDLGAPK